MASHVDEFDLDDGGLDDFDFGDPFGDGDSPKDDRSPTSKFAGGFLEGVKETATKPSTYVDFMRKALPEGYSAAYDVVEDTTSKGLGLYNDVVTDLRPAVRDLKRLLSKAKGAVDGVLPEKMSKKLDSWLEDKEDAERRLPDVDPAEARIASDLADIFKMQAETDERNEQTELLGQAVDTKRHATQTEQLDDIRRLLNRITSYQDTVNFGYQKKSLELQYRQYFAQRDLLEVTKGTAEESVTLLRGILKNSALPDIQKTYDSELMTRMTKERLFGSVQERIAPYAREFLDPFFKNIGRRLKEKTSEFKDMVSMAAMSVEQGDEIASMMEDMGVSKEELAGKAVGGMGSEWLAQFIGKKLRPYIEKNEKVVAGGYNLGYHAENYDTILKSKLEDAAPTNPILQMFQEAALEALRVRAGTRVGYDDISKFTEQVPFDNGTRKSIVEIIPGYLSRILQSIESLRTGKQAPLMTYDHKTNRYVDSKGLAKRLREEAVDKFTLERIGSRSTEMVDKIDPEKSINSELRDKLRLHLVKQAQQRKGFEVDKYSDEFELARHGFTAIEAEQIADAVRRTMDTDYDGKVAFTADAQKSRRDIARDMRSLRDLMPSIYEFSNIYANTGNRDAVRDSGLTKNVRGEDHVDPNFLFERIGSFIKGELDADTSSEVPTDGNWVPNAAGGRRYSDVTGGDSVPLLEAFRLAQEGNQKLLREFLDSRNTNPTEPLDTSNGIDRLIAAIREESSREKATEASATLQEIREIIESIKAEGITTNVHEIQDSEDGRKWKRLRKATDRVKGFGRTIAKPFKGLLNIGSGYVSGIKNVLGRGVDVARTLKNTIMDPIKDRYRDLYVPGEATPRIKAAAMKAGEYIDEKTGKVITSIRDIKGKVVDKAGNTIIEAKEVKDLLTAKGESAIKGFIGSAVDKSRDLLGWIGGQFGKGFQLPFSITAKAFGSMRKMLNRSPDVYVMGEATPRLLGGLLRAGHYISAKTRKPIYTVDDIDGDVIDSVTGQVILTASDAAKGLVDRWGKPIRTLLGKLKDAGKKLIGAGASALKWGGEQIMKGFSTVGDILKGGWRGVKDAFSGVNFGKIQFDPVVASVDRIYDLLVKYFHLKGMSEEDIEAKGIFDPQTGDVDIPKSKSSVKDKAKEKLKSISDRISDKSAALKDRAGSWWNQKYGKAKERVAETKDRVLKAKEEKSGGSGWLGTIIMALSGVGGSIVTALKWLGGIIAAKSAIGAAGDLADLGDLGDDGPDKDDRKKKGRGKGKGRWWNRGGRNAGGVKKGGLLRTLGRGAMAAGRFALGAGGLALRALPLVASAGAAVLGAVGSVISAPVILAAAAVAAVGYVGYKVYRHYKDRLLPLQRLRFSQYGIPLDNIEKCTIVGQMEEDLKRNVIWADGKAVNIDSRFNLEEILVRFGIDKTDRPAVSNFATWFQERFKPVYLTHLTVLSMLSPGTTLPESDTMPDYLKVTYARATHYNTHASVQPYRNEVSPFPDVALVRGREIIDSEVAAVIAEFKDAPRPDKKTTTTKSKDTKPDLGPKVGVQVETEATKALSGLPNILPKPKSRSEVVSVPGGGNYVMAPPTNGATATMTPVVGGDKSTKLPDVTPRNEFVTAVEEEDTAARFSKRDHDAPQPDLYASIPDAKGNGSWYAFKGILTSVAAALGIDVKKLATLARLESSFDANVKARTSSAKGLFQFIASTWRGMMSKFADSFGIPKSASPTDPKAAAILAGQMLKMNEQALQSTLGRAPDLTESYLAHFLGTSGSKTFLGAPQDALASDVMPAAAKSNASIFYKPTGESRTVAEVIEVMRKKVEGGSSSFTETIPTKVTGKDGVQVDISTRSTPVPTSSPSTVVDPITSQSPTPTDVETPPAAKPMLSQAVPDSVVVNRPKTSPYPIYDSAETVRKQQIDSDRERLFKSEAKKRATIEQQTTMSNIQRQDMVESMDLARRSLVVQESMEGSLKSVVDHLKNLVSLAAAEKPDVKLEPVTEPKPKPGPVSSAAPLARLSMARTYR